jgi:hypothetical protein
LLNVLVQVANKIGFKKNSNGRIGTSIRETVFPIWSAWKLYKEDATRRETIIGLMDYWIWLLDLIAVQLLDRDFSSS